MNAVPSYCEWCPLMELLSPAVFAFIQVMAAFVSAVVCLQSAQL
ncbi:hypothetical protein LEMLEM_LOCUS22174 [Lemmus lemmus]